MAVVERSVLVEHARVERHGKVQNSVIGPNTEVAAGEVSSCVLGPFVGCHHQSLLISTLWPAGRGNVGYGANVGSNHTSRAPDQEFRAGEGLFLGLGVNVKFPCDFSRAPYTVIACGTNLPPQKVTFPFSLIAPPQEHFPGVPPMFNQITPGVDAAGERLRPEAVRGQVPRPQPGEAQPVRLRRLPPGDGRVHAGGGPPAAPRSGRSKAVYTERDIPGLGKNVLTESDRHRAMDAYRFYTRYYALLGLRDQVRDALARRGGRVRSAALDAGSRASGSTSGDSWSRTSGSTDPAEGLRQLVSMA